MGLRGGLLPLALRLAYAQFVTKFIKGDISLKNIAYFLNSCLNQFGKVLFDQHYS